MMLFVLKMSEVLQNTEKSCCASETLSWPSDNEIEFLVYVMRGLLTVMIFVWAILDDFSDDHFKSEEVINRIPDAVADSDKKEWQG